MLSGAHYFTTLDMASGYRQMPMEYSLHLPDAPGQCASHVPMPDGSCVGQKWMSCLLVSPQVATSLVPPRTLYCIHHRLDTLYQSTRQLRAKCFQMHNVILTVFCCCTCGPHTLIIQFCSTAPKSAPRLLVLLVVVIRGLHALLSIAFSFSGGTPFDSTLHTSACWFS